MPKFDKEWFYENLKGFENKYLPIFIDITLNRHEIRYRLIFSWTAYLPSGKFNPMMSAQLIDTTKQGSQKYVVPDLIFNSIEEGVTTDFKLYKYLRKWIENALQQVTGK